MSCNGWYKLEELLKIKYGKNQKKVQDNENGIYPIYGTGGLMGYSKEYLYNKPSILIGRKGSISRVKYVEHPFWTVDTLFYTEINENLVIPKYLYYKMSMIDFNFYNEGTTIPSLRTDTLNKIEFQIHSLEEQEKIVNILSSLDDKIELNNEMNKTLEEMAQSIFKRWFVDFEFPNEDGLPYKSSGGDMVESELGMIPKGWEVKTIEEISTTVSKGTTPTKKDMDSAEDENNINFIKVKDIDDYGEICLDNLEKIPESVHNGKLKRSILYEKDILFSIAGTIGRVTAIDKTLNNSNMNQAIAFIRLKDCRNMFNFIFYLLKSEKTQNDIKSNIVQAVQANVSLGVLKAIKFVQPSKEILDKYNNIAMNIYDKQQNIRYENNDLKIIRDNLLPKLMSGEIILDKKIIIY